MLDNDIKDDLLAKIATENLDNKVYITAMALYEVRRGIHSLGDREDLMNKFDGIMEILETKCLDDIEIFKKASQNWNPSKLGEERAEAIGHRDLLIAGQAEAGNYTVITEDDHFDAIPEVSRENWIDEVR